MLFPYPVKFSNFRSIANSIEIPFAKKISFVVGPNNIGKSNVLRFLAILFRILDAVRHFAPVAARWFGNLVGIGKRFQLFRAPFGWLKNHWQPDLRGRSREGEPGRRVKLCRRNAAVREACRRAV
ncbi:AAA family ATPase [Mesorhizobium calcicola]|uniref:AAA family ATPase n=1 Tax=Mesorhizobium calcicola TaxID=1300310 RepID=A0ABW4W7R8_9HYPH